MERHFFRHFGLLLQKHSPSSNHLARDLRDFVKAHEIEVRVDLAARKQRRGAEADEVVAQRLFDVFLDDAGLDCRPGEKRVNQLRRAKEEVRRRVVGQAADGATRVDGGDGDEVVGADVGRERGEGFLDCSCDDGK